MTNKPGVAFAQQLLVALLAVLAGCSESVMEDPTPPEEPVQEIPRNIVLFVEFPEGCGDGVKGTLVANLTHEEGRFCSSEPLESRESGGLCGVFRLEEAWPFGLENMTRVEGRVKVTTYPGQYNMQIRLFDDQGVLGEQNRGTSGTGGRGVRSFEFDLIRAPGPGLSFSVAATDWICEGMTAAGDGPAPHLKFSR